MDAEKSNFLNLDPCKDFVDLTPDVLFPPTWITLHGLPGCGKSTSVKHLIERLKQSHYFGVKIYIVGERLVEQSRVQSMLRNPEKEALPLQMEYLKQYSRELDQVPQPDFNVLVIEHVPIELIHHFNFVHMNITQTISAEASGYLTQCTSELGQKRKMKSSQFRRKDIYIQTETETALTNLQTRDPGIYGNEISVLPCSRKAGFFARLFNQVKLLLDHKIWEYDFLVRFTESDSCSIPNLCMKILENKAEVSGVNHGFQ